MERHRKQCQLSNRQSRQCLHACPPTGLRRGELFALKWEDVDFEQLQLTVNHSIVRGHVGPCKTEASQKPVPMDSMMADALLSWKLESPYSQLGDWVFASERVHGYLPWDPQNIMQRYIRPAAQRAGISKHIGWHTFRHTYSTLLRANNEDVKVLQELLRHANSRITLDTYTQALTESKRQAQKRVIEMILRDDSASA